MKNNQINDKTKYKLKNFYCSSKKLTRQIELFAEEETLDVKRMIELLMDAYSRAMNLPFSMEVSEYEIEAPVTKRLHFVLGDYDMYWIKYNPFEVEEEVACILSDDFNDIYHDLTEGNWYYENGYNGEALIMWRQLFDSHWGKHVITALTALHELR